MSIEHMAVVLHHSKARGTAKLVLLGIANHEGDGGAWPSVATLARYAGVDERNVRKAIRTLEGLGELRTALQAGGLPGAEDSQRPNRYSVAVMCPPWCDRTAHHRDTRTGRQGPLWIDPLTESSPGDEYVPTPLTESSPHPLTESSPEPSKEPSSNPPRPPASTPGRARVCSECGQTEARCRLVGPDRGGHEFTPRQETADA